MKENTVLTISITTYFDDKKCCSENENSFCRYTSQSYK